MVEIVLVMGCPGAGKSSSVGPYLAAGYRRVNRDTTGGKLDDLVAPVERALREPGARGVVLDNTYPSRKSRRAILDLARRLGVPVRCVWLATSLEDASVNVVQRMIEKKGRLLEPAEIQAASRTDPNLFPPVVLHVYRKNFEEPSLEEGFASVERVEFVRRKDPSYAARALLLDYDGTIRRTRSGAVYPSRPDDVELLPRRREVLERYVRDGYRLLGVSNQGDVGNGRLPVEAARACFERTGALLGLPIEYAFCPHKPTPPSCWCRKPMPGLAVQWIERYRLDRDATILVGDMDTDRQVAERVGVRFVPAAEFFGDGPSPGGTSPRRRARAASVEAPPPAPAGPAGIADAIAIVELAARTVESQAEGMRTLLAGLVALDGGDAPAARARRAAARAAFESVAAAYARDGAKLMQVQGLLARFEGIASAGPLATTGATRPLGRSGLAVSPIGLGAMRLSTAGRPAEAAAVRVLAAALDGGITFIDTADVYALDASDVGHNERLVARALAEWGGDASRVVVATKGGLVRRGPRMVPDGRPEHLRAACEASLRALGREAIDLYQLHVPDSRVPFAESVGALADLVRAGKVRHVGLSNVKAAQLDEALGTVPVVSVQNPANPFDAASFKNGTFEACRARGVAFVAYSPVGGWKGRDRVARDATLAAIAARHGATAHEIALAWLLAAGPHVVPIPGATREESVRSNLRALAIRFSEQDRASLFARFPFAHIGSPLGVSP